MSGMDVAYAALIRPSYAEALGKRLPKEMQDAWYQLIGYPILACSNLYDMYYAQAMNQRLAKKNDPEANLWADRVAQCFGRDSVLVKQYHAMNGGKWNHLMSQIHIGYTKWSEPKQLVMPAVKRVEGTPKGTLEQLLSRQADKQTGLQVEKQADRGGKYEFKELDGYVSIEAEHFTRKTDGTSARWTVIPET